LRGRASVAGVLLAGVLSAGTAVVSSRPATGAELPAVAQEISLDGLAIGTVTGHGAHGLLETFFPAPGAPLAASGSFVRVFFAYSPQAGPGSTMVIALNGRAITTVDLDRGHAAGGVLEVPIPAALIDQQHPNRLRVTFDLVAGSAAQDLLYGKLEAPTLIHYSLAVLSTGLPGLETYPWSLLATDASHAAVPTLGVALPSPPDMAETSAALRIFAELGRRAATQRVRLNVITPAQLGAPETHGAGVVLVGRLDHLPAAQRVLAAAGWRSSADGWTAPNGKVAQADDGLVVTALSPWDSRTTIVLVSGGTNAALARAAAALVGQGTSALTGAYAIASAPPPEARGAPLRSFQIAGPEASDIAIAGGHFYEADVSFVAPIVGRGRSADLRVTIPPLDAAGKAAVAVNGSQVAAGTLVRGRSTTLTAQVSGGLLRQGLNSLAVSLRSEPGGSQAGAGGALTASFRLPPPPLEGTDLGALAFPFLDGPQQAVRFLLVDVAPATLTAAVQTAVALGHRSAAPPGVFETSLLVDPGALAGAANLVVVGAPDTAAPLAQMARGLPQAPPGAGVVAETSSGPRTVLWLLGSGEGAVQRAVTALYSANLSGEVATVDAAGKVAVVQLSSGGHGAQATGVPATSGRGAVVVGMLILAVAVLLVSFSVVQLLRAWRVTV
jgi:cellulose synthase subunit